MNVLQSLLAWVARSATPRHLALLFGGALVVAALFWVTAGRSPEPSVASPPTQPPVAPSEPTPPPAVAADEEMPEAETSFEGIDEPPPEPPSRDRPIDYTVEDGDVLWEIAERFGLRTETLVWANDLGDPDLLQVGQSLLIPPVDGVFYTVGMGDRLVDVATRYGVDLEEVVAANELADADQMLAGAEVFLPGGRPMRPVVAHGEPVLEAAVDVPLVPLPPNVNALLGAGWLRVQQSTALFSTPDGNATQLHHLPAGVHLERLEGFQAGRIQVRDPGDGRSRQAMTGWVSAVDLGVGQAPSPRELPTAYPANTRMDIAHVFAPYRTQLDGSPYAQANCGPVAVGMALQAFGIEVSSGQLRREVQDTQRIWGNNVGSVITAMATVVERHGLTTRGLRDQAGGIHRWTLDDVRSHVAQGRPVIVQVRYRSLPGRAYAAFAGDHYILITGLVGDGFLYNDPIDVDGPGWDRMMTADQLQHAMNARDTRYARAGFSVGW